MKVDKQALSEYSIIVLTILRYVAGVLGGLLLIILLLSLFGCQTTKLKDNKFVIDNNTLHFIGWATPDNQSIFVYDLKNRDDKVIYLYLDSTGGEPEFALEVVELIKDKTTVCFANYAFGPAFTVLQACDYRYAREESVIGTSQFQVSGSTGDPDMDKKFMDHVAELEEKTRDIEADNLKIEKDVFLQLVKGEKAQWDGSKNTEIGTVDSIVKLDCAATFAVPVPLVISQFAHGIAMLSPCPDNRSVLNIKDLNPLAPEDIEAITGAPLYQ